MTKPEGVTFWSITLPAIPRTNEKPKGGSASASLVPAVAGSAVEHRVADVFLDALPNLIPIDQGLQRGRVAPPDRLGKAIQGHVRSGGIDREHGQERDDDLAAA